MGIFFENGCEPSDTFGALLKGVGQGLKLGMFIGRGVLITGKAAEAVIKAQQEAAARKEEEERWRRWRARR